MALIQIDQSGKWESSQPTAIGLSVGETPFGALLEAGEKDKICRILGGFSQEKNRSKKSKIIRMFAYTVFLAIKGIYREGDIIFIDEEYPGQENSIRDLLLHLMRRFSKIAISAKNIQFGKVGKNTLAHAIAHQTFSSSRKPDIELKFDDYFHLLDRTEEIRRKALGRRKNKK